MNEHITIARILTVSSYRFDDLTGEELDHLQDCDECCRLLRSLMNETGLYQQQNRNN